MKSKHRATNKTNALHPITDLVNNVHEKSAPSTAHNFCDLKALLFFH